MSVRLIDIETRHRAELKALLSKLNQREISADEFMSSAVEIDQRYQQLYETHKRMSEGDELREAFQSTLRPGPVNPSFGVFEPDTLLPPLDEVLMRGVVAQMETHKLLLGILRELQTVRAMGENMLARGPAQAAPRKPWWWWWRFGR